jgi:ABC-type transport system involved in multi-copper enzyme maturation permease subunit
MSRTGQHAAGGRTAAAIHDLGYKRYLGTRRPQSTRWRVLVKNTVSTAWRGWWRMKAWTVGCIIATVVFGAWMYIARDELVQEMMRRGLTVRWDNVLLPMSFRGYRWFAFVLAAATAAGAVARDMSAGAFEFYFSRPVRPLDYMLGKVIGATLVLGAALLAGPILLALFRVGLSRNLDEVIPAMVFVPRMALVGATAAIAYAVVALAFSSLSTRARITVALWVGFYLLLGGTVEAMAAAMSAPDLAALSLPRAVEGLAFGVMHMRVPDGLTRVTPGVALSYASLVAHIAVGLIVLHVQVRRAERAGLGGG